jgi:phosphoribosylamine--glycine ligase
MHQDIPIVVKEDGLAAGKGVTIAHDRATAFAAIDAIFNTAGASLVIEDSSRARKRASSRSPTERQ